MTAEEGRTLRGLIWTRKLPLRGKNQQGNDLSISQALSAGIDTTRRNEKESKIWSRTCMKRKPNG